MEVSGRGPRLLRSCRGSPSRSGSIRKLALELRVDLPVQLGLVQKFESCRKMCKICADTFLEASPQILCKNCAAQILHNLRTFFGAPAHVSHKFSGTSRDYPAYKFCTIFSDMWHVLRICLCTGKQCLNPRTVFL